MGSPDAIFFLVVFDPRFVFPLSAQCLYVLSDDNTPAVEVLFGDAAYISNLLSIAQSPNAEVVFGSAGSIEQVHLLKVLACGAHRLVL